MTQTTMQFDAVKAEKAKRRGMDFAALYRSDILEAAKLTARCLSNERGSVTADDVQKKLIGAGYAPRLLGNAAGSIFRGPEWECVGWQKSERVSNHGRRIGVWKLRGK